MTAVAVAQVPILIDTREPAEMAQTISSLLTLAKIPTQKQLLGSGDYLLVAGNGETLGIERKTPLDFIGSMVDGRLESQLERMLADYDHRLLLLHGRYGITDDAHVKSGTSWNMRDTRCWYAAYQAKLLSLQGKYDCRLLVVGSDDELVVVLRTLYRQGEEGRFRI